MNRACPYCGWAERRRGPERPGLGYAACARCGSGYVTSALIDFRAFYWDYDIPASLGESAVLQSRYAEMLEALSRMAPGRRLLEVGCGNGHFLASAQRLGWEGCGTELSRAHVERARSAGLDVAYGDVTAEDLFPGRRFDAVVAMELVEHLPEPTRLFSLAAERLVPDGVLFLTTPNFGSLTRRLLGPAWSVLCEEHVALASPRGLSLALRAEGFEVERLRSRSLYLGEYRRVLGATRSPEPSGTTLATENVELRDRIGDSRILSALKEVANLILGATGLGETLECLARLHAERS